MGTSQTSNLTPQSRVPTGQQARLSIAPPFAWLTWPMRPIHRVHREKQTMVERVVSLLVLPVEESEVALGRGVGTAGRSGKNVSKFVSPSPLPLLQASFSSVVHTEMPSVKWRESSRTYKLGTTGNERRPVCDNCSRRGDTCKWGIRLSFRSENNQTIPESHPSMQQDAALNRGSNIEFYDVTHELIRDYWNEVHTANPLNRAPNDARVFAPCRRHDQPGAIYHSPAVPHAALSAAAHLLDMGCTPPAMPTTVHANTPQAQPGIVDATPPAAPDLSPEQFLHDDGIFIPGSVYLELHSTLRNHVFDTARSTYPSRGATPELPLSVVEDGPLTSQTQPSYDPSFTTHIEPIPSQVPTPAFTELSQREEYELWKNWVDEIAPWARFAAPGQRPQSPTILHAGSLRSAAGAENSRAVLLGQPGLVPGSHSSAHTTVAYQGHRSGRVLRSTLRLGDDELCGGGILMDVCGGLISSERTLIPIGSWSPKSSLEDSVQLFRKIPGFDFYANYAVFLCAEVLDLFVATGSDAEFNRRWSELFTNIEDWYANRPTEMKSILSLNAPDGDYARPFPVLLFSNPAAISGNQLYHTAALLMLQRRPRGAVLQSKPRSILWHARRICAISISNTHHGCWTNCVQPLWIAGKLMSHPAEHRAILEIYEMIEKETGWGANWRAEDLKSHWGELDE
ncbi:hypothetical protein DL769_000343 [Monosporascus sp. CRB-8-3]|nr:hypothetical protein DL769_000343 [Monosporascus sp. CRB-8-3]